MLSLNELLAQIEALNKVNNQIQSDLSSESTANDLHDQLQRRLEQLESMLADKQTSEAQLNSQLQAAQSRVAALESEIIRTEEQTKQILSDTTRLHAESDKLSHSIEQSARTLSELEESKATLLLAFELSKSNSNGAPKHHKGIGKPGPIEATNAGKFLAVFTPSNMEYFRPFLSPGKQPNYTPAAHSARANAALGKMFKEFCAEFNDADIALFPQMFFASFSNQISNVQPNVLKPLNILLESISHFLTKNFLKRYEKIEEKDKNNFFREEFIKATHDLLDVEFIKKAGVTHMDDDLKLMFMSRVVICYRMEGLATCPEQAQMLDRFRGYIEENSDMLVDTYRARYSQTNSNNRHTA